MKCVLLEKNNFCVCEFMCNEYIIINKAYIKICAFLNQDQCNLVNSPIEIDYNNPQIENSSENDLKNELFFGNY